MFNSYVFGTTTAVGFLTVIALAFAISVDFNRSSDAAWNEFMSASGPEPDQSYSQGKTSCAQGKRKLPTQLSPLP
jgi:hypothetical protein